MGRGRWGGGQAEELVKERACIEIPVTALWQRVETYRRFYGREIMH